MVPCQYSITDLHSVKAVYENEHKNSIVNHKIFDSFVLSIFQT